MSVRPVFNDEGAGVRNVLLDGQGEISVRIIGSTLWVENLPEKTPVIVYDIMGRTIYNGKEHQINIDKSGVYLVKVNQTAKKIMI